MLKYLLATVIGFLLVGPGAAQPSPTSQADNRVYELRTYTAGTGRLDDLHARFRDHTIRLLEKYGATTVGFWVPSDNADNKLVYLLSYPNQAARDRTWAGLAADPEWLRAKRSSELRDGKLVERIDSTFLTATAYSPTIRAARDPENRRFELRTATASEGQADALHARLRAETLPELERNGAAVLGVWTVNKASGNGTSVMYLVARKPELGESEKDSVVVSLNGVGMRRPAPRPDPSVLQLQPTDYSPMK